MKKIIFVLLIIIFMFVSFLVYVNFFQQKSIFDEPKLPIPLYEP
jgi:hypothetical protein